MLDAGVAMAAAAVSVLCLMSPNTESCHSGQTTVSSASHVGIVRTWLFVY